MGRKKYPGALIRHPPGAIVLQSEADKAAFANAIQEGLEELLRRGLIYATRRVNGEIEFVATELRDKLKRGKEKDDFLADMLDVIRTATKKAGH